MRQMVWFTFFLIFPCYSMEEDCSTSNDSNVCCADFFFKDGKCTPCLSGYYGPNCDFTCPYPSFGRRCLEGKCLCPQKNCDPVTGCRSEVSTRKNNYDFIFERKTSKEYEGNVNSPSIIEENPQSDEKIKESDENKSPPSSPVIVTSVVAAVIIIALVAVILFQVKGRIQARMQTLDTKRRSLKVTSHRHADTYCDIDEDKMEDVECNMDNELEPYELIDQSKKDATKYTELPTRQGLSNHERNLLSTISMQKILDEVGDDKDDPKHVDGSESKVQMRREQAHHAVLPKRMGKTSTKISGYIDMRKNTPESYVSMNAEQLDTDANSQIADDSIDNES